MADEVNKGGEGSGAGEGAGDEVNWQERAEIAEKGLQKREAAYKKLESEHKALKSVAKTPKTDEDGNDYKELYKQETSARTKLVERTRKADVTTAASARLTKVGIATDALDAALQLIDASKVEWDEEGGVDETSVNAAVATLKTKFPVLFEKKVAATGVKNAAEGKTSDAKTITRAEMNALSYAEQGKKMMAGFKVV